MSYTRANYDGAFEQPYGDRDQHELQPYEDRGSTALSTAQFLPRIDALRSQIAGFVSDVQNITSVHLRALNSADPNDPAQRQLNQLTASAQSKSNQIRDEIRTLTADAEQTTERNTFELKKRQIETLNGEFKRELRRYIEEDRQYKERCRDQIARQYRVANPEATEEEVRSAADRDWGNEGVFQTALRSSQRAGEARAVLGQVRQRHEELRKIEQSMVELAQLFQDLDTLVVQQGQTIQYVEQQTEQVNDDLEGGIKQVGTAVKHAASRRKYAWYCLGVGVLIVIILIIVLLVVLKPWEKKEQQQQ